MRILVIIPYLPWPLNAGGNAAQFSTLKCLQEDHEFTLIAPVHSEPHARQALELAARLPRVKVRAVRCFAPPPTDGAAVRFIWNAGRRVRAWLGSSRGAPAAAESPYNPFSAIPAPLIVAVDDELKSGYDLCQVEHAEMLPIAAGLPAGMRKLFVHHQVHFVYARRFIDAHGSTPYSEYLAAWMRVQELAYLQLYDAIVTFSEEDRRALKGEARIERVYASPYPVPADVGIAAEPPPAFDGRFFFLGSEGHDPNREGLSWLLREIWPGIRAQLPGANLVVIGAWSESWKKTAPSDRISFPGFVSELGPFLQGGIMLAPLHIGSGIRTKLLVALAQGVPIVTTPIGAEGLPLRDGHEAFVKEGAAEFIRAAVQLAGDPALWSAMAAAGLALVDRKYSPEGVRRSRNAIYAELAGLR